MPGIKRKQVQDESSTPDETSDQTTQNGKRRKVIVPIDKGFPSQNGAHVFVSSDGTIYDASLQKTDVTKNCNKSYNIQLIKDSNGQHWVQTSWGRTGQQTQSKTYGPFDFETAVANFSNKFKQQTGNSWTNRDHNPNETKHRFLQKHYEECNGDDSVAVSGSGHQEEKKLPVAIKRLMELIFDEELLDQALDDIHFDRQKLPLGRLNEKAIKHGYDLLEQLSNAVGARQRSVSSTRMRKDREGDISMADVSHYDKTIESLTNGYYSAVPHSFRRDCPPLIDNHGLIQKEMKMLDSLRDLEATWKIMGSQESKTESPESMLYQRLKLIEMTPLEVSSNEFQQLKEYLFGTGASRFTYHVEDIFRIEREGEAHRFQTSEHKNHSRLLWHGSNTANFGGILSQGLRITHHGAAINGKAFGKGIYFADMSCKSAVYSSGQCSDKAALLLLCEVELGEKMYEVTWGYANVEQECKAKDFIATKGLGRMAPRLWKDAKCLHNDLRGVLMPDTSQKPTTAALPSNLPSLRGFQVNNFSLQFNEYIVYDESQVRLRYLFRVKISNN